MGLPGIWALGAVSPETVVALSPLRTAIEVAARENATAWQRWAADPEDFGLLAELVDTSPFDLMHGVADFSCVRVWERTDRDIEMVFAVLRKTDQVSALWWVLGPERAAALPGWCGDMILTPEEVRTALPAIERAFTWTPTRSAAVLAELTEIVEAKNAEQLLTEVPRLWREAAAAGRGIVATRVWM
jgi:hypothetical protein